VELAPRDPVHRLEHAQYLAEFGQWELAAGQFRAAVELCGGCPAAERGLGASLLELGRADEAVGPLMLAQAADPDSAGRRLVVAALYAARRDSVLLALLDGEDPSAWTRQDYIAQVEAEGRLARSAGRSQAYAAALQAGAPPTAVAGDALFWGRVALNLLQAEQWEAGLIAVERAIELEPASVVYRNNRVVLLTRLGRHDEAAREWERVVDLDPGLGDGAKR
jgi:tetratricopeptide (TPR) repeat protein